MQLCVNMLIEWFTTDQPKIERILWIDPTGTDVVMFDVENEKALPVWRDYSEIEASLTANESHVLVADPYASSWRILEKIPVERQQHRDKIWQYIKPLVETEQGLLRVEIFLAQQRGALIANRAEETNRAKHLFYRDLRRYWRGGQTKDALLPRFDRCGGKGKTRPSGERKRGRPTDLARATGVAQGINIDEAIRQRLRRGISLFYETEAGHSLTEAYHLTMRKFFNRGYEMQDGVLVPVLPPAEELPTPGQFRYWYQQEQHPAQSLRSRVGPRQFETNHRAILGDSTRMAYGGPGALFQLDATVADVYLISTLDPLRIIGRPVLYLVIDVFSRLIVGFSISLEGPSWLGAMLALENTMTDKVSFCRRHGQSITSEQWPCHHLPQKILADRGELEGYNADNLVNGLGIIVANTPPYRADWKGIVERYFRLTNDRIIRWLPGAVYPDRKRGASDYRLDACLTLAEFTQIILRCILEHNWAYRMDWYELDQFMIADHVEPYPLELWQWGIKNRAGQLRTSPADIIRLNLLPQGQAAIARDGLHFQGLRYTCELAEQEGWFVKARQRGRERITVAYDPRLVDAIYLRLDDARQLVPCYLLDKHKTYLGRDWYDTLDYFALKKQRQEAARSGQLQTKAASDAHIEQIVEHAQKRQQTALVNAKPSKSARLKDIRTNRQAERELEREQHAWQFVVQETGPAAEVTATDVTLPSNTLESAEQSYVPAPQNVALLRTIRQRKLNEGDHREQE